jgi:hypothetical protein
MFQSALFDTAHLGAIPVAEDKREFAPDIERALDAFGEPATWDETVKYQLAKHLIDGVFDDVCSILALRLRAAERGKALPKDLKKDYLATLGWLLGYWRGSISVALIVAYENNDQKDVQRDGSLTAIREIAMSHPVIQADLAELRTMLCGGPLFAGGDDGQ